VSSPSGPVLALDGALGRFSAAVLGPGIEAYASAAGGDALERGLDVIGDVLKRAGVKFDGLAALAVGLGPGSFTGMRIALSYAKAFALARHLPLAGVASYDAVDEGISALPRVTLVSGRTGTACARILGPTGSQAVVCGTLDEVASGIAACIPPGPLACYGATEGVAERLGERAFTVQQYSGGLDAPALAIARVAIRRLLDGSAGETNAHALRPDYGAEPRYATAAQRSEPR